MIGDNFFGIETSYGKHSLDSVYFVMKSFRKRMVAKESRSTIKSLVNPRKQGIHKSKDERLKRTLKF